MELMTTLLTGPVLPATMLLGLMVLWSLLALIGTVDLDVPGGDVDVDLDLDSAGHAGAADGLAVLAMKWLNLKEVPLVLWMGALAVIWWFLSASLWSLIDSRFFDAGPGWLWSSLLVLRNLAIAIPATKLITQPMKGWFLTERLDAHSLIGRECAISSSEATPEFGQVKFQTDGSPLLLNVRTDGPHLAQGARVWITHYDAQRRIYIVSPTGANDVVETN